MEDISILIVLIRVMRVFLQQKIKDTVGIMDIKMIIQTYDTKLEFDFCIVCHRHTSLGHMSVLWEEHGKKMRICYWCDGGE